MRNTLILFLLVLFNQSFSQEPVKLNMYRETVGKSTFIYADNNEFAPISLEFTYTATNLSSSLGNKKIVVIPAKTKKFVITELKPIDSKKGTSFKYDVYYILGDVNADFKESNYVYALPFAKNKNFSVYQGYNGKFSHQNSNSIDFSLQVGDQVYAAREGLVVETVTGNDRNCMSKDCAKFNNKIIILHSDGTLAEYVHLKKGGSVVKVGDSVNQNQLIGYSGNTGWSKGPHLHFSVFTPKIDGERNYVKTKFKVDGSKTPIYLEEKKSYLKSY